MQNVVFEALSVLFLCTLIFWLLRVGNVADALQRQTDDRSRVSLQTYPLQTSELVVLKIPENTRIVA